MTKPNPKTKPPVDTAACEEGVTEMATSLTETLHTLSAKTGAPVANLVALTFVEIIQRLGACPGCSMREIANSWAEQTGHDAALLAGEDEGEPGWDALFPPGGKAH